MTPRRHPAETIDTSVLVPALLSRHPMHGPARQGLVDVSRIPVHAMLECFSVLTRLPHPYRLAPGAAADAVAAVQLEPLGLAPEAQRDVVTALAQAGIGGGAVFDGLIGATARAHGLTLLTLDRRAGLTYEAVGASYRVL